MPSRCLAGQDTSSASLRVDARTSAHRILTIPAGVTVTFDTRYNKNGWYLVSYGQNQGYVSSSLVATRVANVGPGWNKKFGPAPMHGFYKKPYWDNQHQAWYDGTAGIATAPGTTSRPSRSASTFGG